MRALLVFSLLLLPIACADPEPKGRSILMSEDDGVEVLPAIEDVEPSEQDESVSIGFRPPDSDGNWSYRMILEGTGQQTLDASTDHRDAEPIEQSYTLEVEYTELPTKTKEGSERGAFLLRLDALYFRNFQTGTPPQTIEVGGDRLRVVTGKDKVEMDLEGAQPEAGLTPRMLLQQIFGMVIYNEEGETLSVQLRGRPRAREFMKRFPLQGALRFSRVPRPTEAISPGHTWNARRFPPNPVGGLGLKLDVKYSLAGFREIAGVRCAWVLLEGNREGTSVPSEAGFVFDRTRAEIRGEAFIEVETARLRRLLIIDDARAVYQKGKAPKPVVEHRLRHKGRLLIELVEPGQVREKWADGKKRFEPV